MLQETKYTAEYTAPKTVLGSRRPLRIASQVKARLAAVGCRERGPLAVGEAPDRKGIGGAEVVEDDEAGEAGIRPLTVQCGRCAGSGGTREYTGIAAINRT